MRSRLMLILSLLAWPLCLPAASGCPDLSGLPIYPRVQFSQVWQALDNQSSCTQNCHLGSAPTGELDLSNASLAIYFLVGQSSSQSGDLLRVKPGDPEGSLFWQKIACTSPGVGAPMPPPAGGVSVDLMGLIYDWIAQGAYGESSEDPIRRDYLFRDSMESLRYPPPVTFALPFEPLPAQHREPDLESRGFHGGPRT
ncbi:MAG: hypothetical protein AB7E72_02290 [Lysobacterales bacterium]